MRSRLFTTTGSPLVLQWTHVVCDASHFAVVSGNDTVTCEACPPGGQCALSAALSSVSVAPSSNDSEQSTTRSSLLSNVVVQQAIVAQPGWWASTSSDGSTFYPCPIPSACLPGGNGSRARCADGYAGVLCGVCADGYIEQFGSCLRCPTSRSESNGAIAGIVFALLAVVGVVIYLRAMLPIDVMKLGLSMLQVRRD